MIHTLARMYHAGAHAASLSLKTDEVGQIIYYYQQMEYLAQKLKADTLLNISLAYQGGMLRTACVRQRVLSGSLSQVRQQARTHQEQQRD